MFAHVSIGVKNIEKAIELYDGLLGTLGYKRLFGALEEEFMAYGDQESFFIINTPLDDERGKAIGCNGSHVCFKAPSQEAVDAFYKFAIDNGFTDEGAPRIREDYAEDYYAAFVRDVDGNKLEALVRASKK